MFKSVRSIRCALATVLAVAVQTFTMGPAWAADGARPAVAETNKPNEASIDSLDVRFDELIQRSR